MRMAWAEGRGVRVEAVAAMSLYNESRVEVDIKLLSLFHNFIMWHETNSNDIWRR